MVRNIKFNQNIQVLSERPYQKIMTHIVLACLTGGIGNFIYYISVKQKQAAWDRTYLRE